MFFYTYFLTLVLLSNLLLSLAQERIANGNNAAANQFPYQVSLRNQGRHICGGSIIAQSKILSAAHCVTTKTGGRISPSRFEILAGVIDRRSIRPSDGAVLTKVKNVIVHNRYNYRTINYDACVIITYGTFDFSLPNIATIDLTKTLQIRANTDCVISGWGRNENGVSLNFLQYAIVQITARSQCKARMRPTRITQQMICALGRNNEDAQPGDSGGPMVCNGELCGIVSFGKKAPIGLAPGVYTRVARIEAWARTSGGSCLTPLRCFAIWLSFFVLCLDKKINL